MLAPPAPVPPPRHLLLHPVTSSHVHAIGYDPGTRVLAVEFRATGLYYYRDVPAPVFTGLQTALSIGKYLNLHVKPKFLVTRVFPVLIVDVGEEIGVEEYGQATK